MSFGGMKPQSVSQSLPVAPPPPPNPPMFGEQATKKKTPGTPSMQFSASVLGSLPQNTAMKSLLG